MTNEITLTSEEAATLRARIEASLAATQRQRLEHLRTQVTLRELAEAYGFDPEATWTLADDAPVLRRVTKST